MGTLAGTAVGTVAGTAVGTLAGTVVGTLAGMGIVAGTAGERTTVYAAAGQQGGQY